MKRTTMLGALLLAVSTIYAQDDLKLPEVIPPSPTVASLMKFEEVPIDYYSGQPNIAIPIYSKAISKDIALSVALRYSTSGVKIDDRSGWVGTGWALETGGVISRTVRGLPDEFNDHRKGVYNNSDFLNYDNLTTDAQVTYQWKVARGDAGSSYQYDNQLDLYQYSLLGKSGRFVIVKNGSNFEAKLLSKDDNVKIDFTADANGKMSNFIITDALGNRYFLDVEESSYSEPVTATSTQGNPAMPNISAPGASASMTNVTAWHISKIETSNGVELASFTYANHTHTYEASKTRIENKILNSFTTTVLQNSFNNSIFKPRLTASHYATTAYTKKPLKITFQDGSSVNFATSSTAHPETTGAILSSVTTKDKWNQVNKTFNFTYQTTNRLWLTKVSEVAGSEVQDYTLEYQDKSNLPGYGSVSDIYGYNDGNSSSGFDATAIQKGLLKKIIYPTGGAKEFVFEHNTFAYERDQSLTTDDFYELNPSNTTSASATLNYTISSANGSQYQTGSKGVSLAFDQTISVSNNIQIPSNVSGSVVLYLVITGKNGFSYKEVIQPQGTNTVHLSKGSYLCKLEVQSLTLNSYSASGVATINYQGQASSYTEAALGGGVRIKEVLFLDDASISSNPAKKMMYNYNEPGTSKSSGAIDAIGGGSQKRYSYNVSKLIFLSPSNGFAPNGDPIEYNGPCPTAPSTIQYQTIEKGPNAQLTKGNYIGYKHVQVYEQNNGYTRFEYTTAFDYPTPAAAFQYPFTPVPNIDYKRGLLTAQKVYDQAGTLLKETTNAYNFPPEEIIAPSFRVIDYQTCGYSQLYESYLQYKNLTPQGGGVPPEDASAGGGPCFDNSSGQNCGTIPPDLAVINDDLKTSWVQLVKTVNKDYYSGTAVIDSTTYAYNTANFLQKEVNRYVKEKGADKHYKTETIFPVGNSLIDFTTAEQTAITGMVGINKINVPLLVKTSVDGTVTNKVKSIYNSFYTNMYEVSKIATAKGSGAFEDRLTYHGYYTNGNIKEVSKKDGTHVVYIWGYGQTLPVAKIENETYADVSSYVSNIQTLSDADDDRTQGTTGDEGALRSALNSLRTALPNAMITTITYDPLVGATSMTDPRGNVMYYEYDDFNRLKVVKDKDGHIVSENQYHYKN